ncbi:MAG: amidohydrolase/deacetylase family metallohydrolase, partial [bacterium]|nr:amidohydrolase/deacetylase family metallohydrolase [bacterium]
MYRTPLLLLLAALCWGQPYDLVLAGGHVIDPKNNINGPADVAIRDGRIAAVGGDIDRSQAERVLDVSGLRVTPGLVDIHTHVFYSSGVPNAWAGDNSVQPDAFSFRTGVTTMVDAGSSGWRNFEAFRTLVIDRARTRVLALINIAGFGMVNDLIEQGDFDPEAVARLAAKHKDVVVGVKSAHYTAPDWGSVDAALEAGRAANIPIMVDFGHFLRERPFFELVTKRLRSGDIATHAFRGPVPWVDSAGKLYPYLREARKRGVRFDVGHGGGSFVFRNAAPAIAQSFYPDLISTDLHTGSMNGAMMDMPTTMAKFLAMGMPLPDVVLASTWTPAQIIGREQLGHLSVGAPADVAVWRILSGQFAFADAARGKLQGSQRLLCEITLKDGAVTWDWNARTG